MVKALITEHLDKLAIALAIALSIFTPILLGLSETI